MIAKWLLGWTNGEGYALMSRSLGPADDNHV